MNLQTLRPESLSRDDARTVQRELARLRLYDGDADGLFGSASRAALIAQRRGAVEIIDHVGGVRVYRLANGAIMFTAGLTIDADGHPRAYAPAPLRGLDALGNAGEPGNWYGVVTNTGEKTGRPVIQGADDPAPGYYVSATSLQDPGHPRFSQRRYLHSGEIPFIVLPGRRRKTWGCQLGDYATAERMDDPTRRTFAVFGDDGPDFHAGEASMAVADALGIRSDPRTGGVKDGVIYTVAPRSGRGFPDDAGEIRVAAAKVFTDSPLPSGALDVIQPAKTT